MKLIVQGCGIAASCIREIASFTKPSAITQTHETVWLFSDISEAGIATVRSYCAAIRADAALLPDNASLKDYRFLAMDMDSTFIQIECIDEIADFCGIKDEVAAITAAAMRGELDFNESLTRRVALLKGFKEEKLQQVFDERVRLSPGAEIMLRTLHEAGIKILLVSGGFTFFTEQLRARYRLDFAIANTLETQNGQLTGKITGDIVNADKKEAVFLAYCQQLGITPDQAIAVGDGANDIKMLRRAGLSIAYHAKPQVRQQAMIALDYSGLDGIIHLLH